MSETENCVAVKASDFINKLKLLALSAITIFGFTVIGYSYSFSEEICLNSRKIDTPVVIKGKNAFQAGDFIIGAQPAKETLRWTAYNGVTIVINLRTVEEVESHKEQKFDEDTFVKDLGMKYVNIPLGGNAEYSSDKVDILAQALSDRQGKVFIHCRHGGRAIIFWTSYIIRFCGFTTDAAINLARKMMPNLDKSNKRLNMLMQTGT